MVAEIRHAPAVNAELRSALVALLFRHDPIQISYETNSEEYAPEAARIMARLGACLGAHDVCRVVYEEFVRSFGVEASGSLAGCEQIAGEVWELWLRLKPAR